MAWSETILEQFQPVYWFTTEEREYYGPYTTLLVKLFPDDEGF
jgi:hypothetical protein